MMKVKVKDKDINGDTAKGTCKDRGEEWGVGKAEGTDTEKDEYKEKGKDK